MMQSGNATDIDARPSAVGAASVEIDAPVANPQHIYVSALPVDAAAAIGTAQTPVPTADSTPAPVAATSKDKASKRPAPSCTGRLGMFITSKARYWNFLTLYLIVFFILFQNYMIEGVLDGLSPDSDDPGPWSKSTDPYSIWLAKLIVPQVEFSVMFLLLWGMAWFPISMCRWIANQLSKTNAARYLPLQSLTAVHIAQGIHFLVQVCFVVILFMAYFGVMCWRYNNGLEAADYCRGTTGQVVEDGTFYTSEIMSTGYAILGLTLIMCISGLLRRRMSYEWFYGLHHLFIVLYAVSIAHTLDARGREKFSSRMQIVLWVAGPLVIYFVDRFMRNATIRSARVTSVKLLAPEKGSPNVNGSANRTLFLRLARPAGFTFTLGQYVRINIPEVSVEEYHPFTIGSASSAEQLELIISVVPSKEGLLNGKKTADSDGLVPTAGGVQEPNCLPGKGPGTWTERAFAYFEALSRNPEAVTYVKLEGPYGSILQSAFGLPNLALFASGSGIVPMLATLREYHGADKMSIRARAAAVPIASPGSPISPQPAGDMEHGGAAAAGGAAPPSPPHFPPALSPGFSNQSDATHSRASSTGLPSVAPSLASNASFASTIDAELKSYGFNAPEPVPQPMVVLETVLTPAPIRDEGHEHRAAIQGSNKKRVLIAKSTRFIATGPDSTSKSASSSTTSTSFVTDPLGLHVIPPPEPPAPMTGDGAIETLRVFMDVRREKTLYARAASQYPYVFAGSLLLACLQFALICLEISWYEMGVGREADLHGIDNWTWMFKGLDIVTAIAIAGFALLIIVQPYLLSEPNTTGLSSGVRKTRTGPMILPLVAAAAQAALVAYNFGNPRPTDTGGGILLVALLLLRVYQLCWHYASNPLLLVHGAESAAAVKRGAAFTQSIQLVWSSRSASAVLALADELRGIAGDVAAACGPEALRIRAFITGPVTAAEKADLARFTKPNKPFIVSLGRPDTDELLHHMCAELAGEDVNAATAAGKQDPSTTKDRPTIATGDAASTSGATAIGPVALRRDKALNVLFCGAPGLASAVRDSVLRAREAFGGKGVVLAYNSETVFG